MYRFVPLLVAGALVFAGCASDRDTSSPAGSPTPGPASSAPEGEGSATAEYMAVVGDFGTGDDDAHEVAEAIRSWVEEVDAGALLTTGDNVYPDGAPEHHDEAWEEPYGWTEEREIAVLASLGNHDAEYGHLWEVVDLLDMPDRWYRTSLGSIDVFVLDSNIPEDQAQLEWLQKELDNSDATWQIAVFHHPPYSCSRHGSDSTVRDLWVTEFEEAGIDLVLAGHEHNLQRFEQDGITYVVTGGGGANLYPIEDCPADGPELLAGDDEQHHYLQLEIAGDELHGSAVTPEGEVLDTFTVEAHD